MLAGAAAGGGQTATAHGGGSGCSSTDETDSSSFDSDIKNIMISSPPLGPTFSAVSASATSTAPSSLSPHMAHLQKHHKQQAKQQNNSTDGGVSLNGSEPTPSSSDPQNVTPVYWSASQLLSKLDHSAAPGSYSPYVTTVQGSRGENAADQFFDGYNHHRHHHVHPGPHSLQPYDAAAAAAQGGAYSTSSGIPCEWPAFQRIPEEFTITVGKLSQSAAAVTDDDVSRKVPPPVMPKPRNITQV